MKKISSVLLARRAAAAGVKREIFSRQRSAVSSQRAAGSGQRLAVSGQRSAGSGQPKADPVPEGCRVLMGEARSLLSDLHGRIAELQKSLIDSGMGNDTEAVARRSVVVDEKLRLSKAYGDLFEEKERIHEVAESRALCDADFDRLRHLVAAAGSQQSAGSSQQSAGSGQQLAVSSQQGTEPTENPADTDALALTEPWAIAKKITSLRTRMRRNRVILDYQSRVKGGKPLNPMPDCPKRREIEADNARMEKLVEELRKRLAGSSQTT